MTPVPNRDPNRVVRAEIRDAAGQTFAYGVNKMVCQSTEERWADKHDWVMHAEEDAIHEGYRSRWTLAGCIMVTDYFPCARCANHIARAGIKQVVAPTPDLNHHRWGPGWRRSLQIFEENGVVVRPLD